LFPPQKAQKRATIVPNNASFADFDYDTLMAYIYLANGSGFNAIHHSGGLTLCSEKHEYVRKIEHVRNSGQN
jgi:hypothetical protein